MSHQNKSLNPIICRALLAAVMLPPAYLLFMMQWGGLRYPFWDHVSNYEYVIAVHDGTLRLASLFKPHNEHMIFIPRLIHALVAQVTSWSISAEFTLLFLTYLATFGIIAAMTRRAYKAQSKTGYLTVLFAISLFFFSPAQHNNFWWTFMLQLALTSLFSYAAFFVIGSSRKGWAPNLLAILLCWCAIFSMANGLIAMLACFICVMIVSVQKSNTRTDFAIMALWGANFIAAAWLQISVRGQAPQGARAGLADAVTFLAIYAGNPLRSLLAFPYRNMWDIPRGNQLAIVVGLAVLLISGLICIYLARRLRRGDERASSALACILFGIGSGAVIAIGRAAFDQTGVANAAASRYVIYSTFIYIGLALSLGSMISHHLSPKLDSRIFLVLVAAFAIPALFAYARGTVVFADSARFNQTLSRAYELSNSAEINFDKVYPQREQVIAIRRELLARRLGPYMGLP
jgi:uncharacterized membrane protein